MVDREAAGGDGRLQLAQKLDLRGSEALIEALRAAEGGAVAIDASEVDLLGAHALQTLIVAQGAWAAAGHPFTIENMSEAMAGALESFGISGSSLGAAGAA